MKLRNFVSLAIVFLVTLTIAIGCSNPATKLGSDPSAPSSSVGETVRLGFSAWPGWFPWQVAQEKGLFEQNELSVDLIWFDGYLESINTLVAEQIDANSQTLGDTVSSLASGAEQVIVLVNDNSTGNDKVIVRDGINNITELKGKKVAAEEGTVDHFLLLLGMQKAGLSPDDIEFVPLETGKAASAFVAEQVDAVAVFAPFTTQALKRPGSKELFSSKDYPGSISDHLVYSKKFVEEHPEEVQKSVDTWFKALDFIKANPDASASIMAKRAGVTVGEYQQYAEGTQLFTVAENLAAFQPADNMSSLPFAATQMSQFLVEVGLIPKAPDTSGLFDDRFVKAYAEKTQ